MTHKADPIMMYQAKVDGRVVGPAHSSWREAAVDLVNAGYAVWHSTGIKHLPEMGSEIARWLSTTVEI